MKTMDKVEELRSAWRNQSFDACERIAATLSRKAQARFGTAALRACLAYEGGPEELFNVVRIGDEPEAWDQAHAAFDAVRDLTLARERVGASGSDPGYLLLFVGENTARVIYNATHPRDPFDDDSCAWLLKCLAQFVHFAASDELERHIWECLPDQTPSATA
jgi:hypothetical protein